MVYLSDGLFDFVSEVWAITILRQAQEPSFDPSTSSGTSGSGTILRQAQEPPHHHATS
ncbi:MAG: hypothetical protein K9H49_03835 [Bacteroidales bacterium]|nr:hypothetical protein [Bacteroidales bacterium]MCF8389421.1 hypothetical protein [Bacteroidales bacterium]